MLSQAPTPGMPVPGDILMNSYRLERVLEQGGMGTVFAATQLSVDRTVAIKTILPHMARDATLLARFQREVDLAKQLNHPNIVELYDSGRTDDGLLYLVMELLDGLDLHDAITQSGPMRLGRAGRIAVQTLDALHVAHEAQVVHRDLKPSNIFLTRVGRHEDFVKLLDFGIARSLSPQSNRQITQVGQVFGTSSYMSPEMFMSAMVDQTADVYAMGLIILEMLIGEQVFQGRTAGENMMLQLRRGVELPKGLRHTRTGDIIERATQREIERRFPSAKEMLAELEEALTHDPHDLILDPMDAALAVQTLGALDDADGPFPEALPRAGSESTTSATKHEMIFVETSTGDQWRVPADFVAPPPLLDKHKGPSKRNAPTGVDGLPATTPYYDTTEDEPTGKNRRYERNPAPVTADAKGARPVRLGAAESASTSFDELPPIKPAERPKIPVGIAVAGVIALLAIVTISAFDPARDQPEQIAEHPDSPNASIDGQPEGATAELTFAESRTAPKENAPQVETATPVDEQVNENALVESTKPAVKKEERKPDEFPTTVVRLESEPKGAIVSANGDIVGATPVARKWRRDEVPSRFRFELDGFRVEEISTPSATRGRVLLRHVLRPSERQSQRPDERPNDKDEGKPRKERKNIDDALSIGKFD